ncbi:MAG: family glycosyltransferase [Gemmataceae bacterium]|nr:family glycosyltransferase [Gemmataceae bacterium]
MTTRHTLEPRPSGLGAAPVSVVIPAFNCGHLITQAVESVLAQTLSATEILVVDDGSTDDTRQRIAAYAGRVRYLYQANQGVSAARNLGVQTAGQEFVAFLDADDVWHPRKLEFQMPVFASHPELGLVGTHSVDWPAVGFPTAADPHRVRVVSWAQLVVKNALATSSVVVRRRLLARAGPFDSSIQGPEDRDLWLRVAELAPVANLELPLMGYRDVPGSVSKQAERCQAGMIRILQKLDERKVWRRRWLLRRRAYSYAYHSCAYLHGAAGSYDRALTCSWKSLLWYPFPYSRREVQITGERPKRLLVNLLRWFGVKGVDAHPVPAGAAEPLAAPR